MAGAQRGPLLLWKWCVAYTRRTTACCLVESRFAHPRVRQNRRKGSGNSAPNRFASLYRCGRSDRFLSTYSSVCRKRSAVHQSVELMAGVHASWAQQFHGPPIRVGDSNKVQQTGNCAAETERLDFACDVKSLGFPETTVGRRGVQASAPLLPFYQRPSSCACGDGRSPRATAILKLCPRRHFRSPFKTTCTSAGVNPRAIDHSVTDTPCSRNH